MATMAFGMWCMLQQIFDAPNIFGKFQCKQYIETMPNCPIVCILLFDIREDRIRRGPIPTLI